MSDFLTPTATTLIIKRTYNAPRERVFAAWTRPELLKRWWGQVTTPIVEVDLRTGGHWRLGMTVDEAGTLKVVSGIYYEITPPEKLVYSWRWEGDAYSEDATDSLVTVEFQAPTATTTEVILTHERLDNEAARDHHAQGWLGCVDRLEQLVGEWVA